MIFSSINVVPNHIFHKDPEKSFSWICIHNEKMFVDMTDDTRGQIDNALAMLKILLF